ncbi:MAG TPA: tyrosine--tRNA ligase [Chloroflexota bacterium]|nr:tyrosine--tRNA ligase [Chloroflexota bacterium]
MVTAVATNVLDVLRSRGFVAQVSDEDALRRAFDTGPVTVYQGFDPTATSLHAGNLVGIMALAHFQRAGHRPIALVGGGTGMIGDPSGRASERPMLSVADIQRNLAGIRTQFSRYLDFSGDRALLLDNAEWLLDLKWIEFLRDVGRYFTVNQLMQHGTYRERFETGSFAFIELNYALVQAYDFLHLFRAYGCRVQQGGNDQWFNILAGRDLIHHADAGEAFALTTPLITTTSGQKMSKSAGNAPWLDPRQTSPYDFYQYWRNTEDADVGRFLRLFTFLPLEEIAELERKTGAELNDAKAVLAFEATRITHGDDEARKAEQTARARFGGGGEDVGPSVAVRVPTGLVELAVQAGLAESRNAAKRHLQTGGFKLDGQTQSTERLVDPSELPLILSLGKRKVRLVAGSDSA